MVVWAWLETVLARSLTATGYKKFSLFLFLEKGAIWSTQTIELCISLLFTLLFGVEFQGLITLEV